MYEVRFFEKNSWYFGKNGTADDLSAGLGGTFGARDDGLPAAYDQFSSFAAKARLRTGRPHYSAGKVQPYAAGRMYGLWADYEGKENMA